MNRARIFGDDGGSAARERVSDTLTLVRASARTSSAAPVTFHGLHAQTTVMQDLFRKLTRVAATDLTLLITGEFGTGKSLAARAVHDASERAPMPFVSVRCSALADDLAMHVVAAAGGTLLLHEVADLSAAAQAHVCALLETLDETRAAAPPVEVRADRLAIAPAPARATLRVVATTNRDLERLAAEGQFREDLLYRLRVASVALPTLRERAGDIAVLASHFLTVLSAHHRRTVRAVDAAAFNLLLRYHWPGNVRELRNVLESALILAEGAQITTRDLPLAMTVRPNATITSSLLSAQAAELPFIEARERALKEFDRAYLGAALARFGGNVARTARALGLHRQSLQKLLVRRELRPPGEGTHDA